MPDYLTDDDWDDTDDLGDDLLAPDLSDGPLLDAAGWQRTDKGWVLI